MEVFAEIGEGRLAKSVDGKAPAITDVHLVHVQLENLLFREALLELHRHHRFGQFAAPRPLRAKEETPRHLHGQRAGALQVRFVAQVGPRRAQNAHGIETGVLEKSLVFRGENRVQERLRNVGVAHRPALFARTIKQIRDQLGLDVRARKLVAAAERPDGTDGLAGKLDL